MSPRAHGALVLASLLAITAPTRAQTLFTENFDNLGPFVGGQAGPAALVQQGWIFRVQSGAVLAPSPFDYGWRSGPYNVITGGFFTFAAQAGSGCLATDHTTARPYQGVVQASNWAILPAIAGQAQGSELTFWARQEVNGPFQILEVRYSPTGGTSTGSSVVDVGDFTDLLLSVAPPSGNSWGFHSVSLPGSGRIAIRYYLPDSQWGNFQVAGIDTLAVGAPMGPCPDYPTVPAAGQTVHWTAADSPHEICAHTVIPPGATVIVDPGAVVLVDAGSVLEVRGNLQVGEGARIDTPFQGSVLVYGTASFLGTASNRVRLTGGPRSFIFNAPERIAAMPGARITAEEVDLQTTISALGTGLVLATNVHASGTSNGFFGSGDFLFYGGNLAIRDSSFTAGAAIFTLGTYMVLDDCLFDDATFRPGRPWVGQTMYIDDIVARNRTGDSVFHLYGSDFFFGPGNVISGNAYPVMLEGAGIAAGSTLPSTGNTNNRIHTIPGAEGLAHFSDAGIQYEVQGNTVTGSIGGKIVVEPGVTLRMGPGAGFGANFGSYYGSPVELEGLPDAPITLERLDRDLAWDTVSFGANGNRPKVEYAILRGAVSALSAIICTLRVESCLFEKNDVGLAAGSNSLVLCRGSKFFSNVVGAQSLNFATLSGRLRLDAKELPNWFENNLVGLETLNTIFQYDDARENYWGHVTGPDDELNPTGHGDSTPGSNLVLPFRTLPPVANHAPVVRLERHSRLLEEGEKVILHWSAFDDDAITGFRILYSPHGENPGLSLLVDGIPATARSWEIVVPTAPPASNYPDLSALRVEATDTLGQTGFDDMDFQTPYLAGYAGGFQPGDLPGVHRPGELFTFCGQWYGGANPGVGYEAYVWLEGDEDRVYPLGGSNAGDCFLFEQEMPPFSTDLARIVTIHTGGAGGRVVYGFSDYFEIRPDPAMGDAPPQITLLSPVGGELFVGGGTIPIQWTASDDEALRSFEIHASYDGGRTWHTIESDLPATSTGFDWRLPPSSGIDDVRVRVVARDLRFQNTTATSQPFSIQRGSLRRRPILTTPTPIPLQPGP